MSAPRQTYEERLRARRAALAQHEQRDARIAYARLGVVVMGIATSAIAYQTSAVTPLVGLVALPVFVVLAIVHDRVLRAKERVKRAIAHVERGIARIDDTWRGKGTTGERFLDAEHPFASDLDLFGPSSLFQLLCTARTRAGEAKLAAWLTHPTSSAAVVRERQAAVRELHPLVDLREDVDALAADASVLKAKAAWSGPTLELGLPTPSVKNGEQAPDPQSQSPARSDDAPLLAWAKRPSALPPWTLAAACAFVAVSLTCIALDTLDVVPRFVTLIALGAQMAFAWHMRARARETLRGIDEADDELKVLADLLARLEGANGGETFHAPLLVALQKRLGSESPSRVVARLTRHVDRLHQQENQFFLPIAALLLWKIVHAALIARWRAQAGPKLPEWIDVVAEMEALLSLSAYAFEHPDDVEPVIVDDTEPPTVRGAGLGHPLLPGGGVRNGVALGPGDGAQLYVVSGSNMSGKSTYLRAVGVNVALALAGGRVRATAFTVSPVLMGATLRVQDSLEKGASRFFAEITRLQLIMKHASRARVLFLVDELLAGTNSRDRQVGGAAILKGLVAHGAIGLATTHDLALAAIADDEALRGKVRNVHFEDVLDGDRVVFDYKLKDGVVERSNAIALMRAVGLDV